MAPLSLLDCPEKVQRIIAKLLFQADLAHLSVTCRTLRKLAEPFCILLSDSHGHRNTTRQSIVHPSTKCFSDSGLYSRN